MNDDWRDTQEQAIFATGLPPNHDWESAIVTTLDPDLYTAIVRGKGDNIGTALVEVYDLGSAQLSRGRQHQHQGVRGV